MKKTIYLEASLDKDILKIGIYIPGRPMRTYEEISAPMESIEKHCRKMAETLNRNSRKGGETPDVAENLKSVGRMLCDDLLTPRIKEYLGTSPADYLVLNLDDHLVHIPWELLWLDNDFLCRRFNMGRYVKTRQKISENTSRERKTPLEMWILANPGGDLPSALSEGMKVFRCTSRINQKETVINPSLDSDIRPDRIKLKIKDYDFIHFAGHADYTSQTDPGGPGAGGWKLTDGNLKADDIYKMAGGSPMPSLVFSNACQSARTEKWEWSEDERDGSFGLANAFLFSGVKHYVGTFWEIMDEPSSHFALEFYKHLLAGKTVGESMRTARLALAEEYGDDSAVWASYLLYGDPTFSYFGQNEAIEDPVPFESSVLPSPSEFGRKLRTSGGRGGSKSKNKSSGDDKGKEGQKNTRIWGIAALVALLFLCGTVFGYLGVSEYFRLEAAKMMADATREKQDRICRLIEKFRETAPALVADQPISDKTAAPLTLAIVYDSIKSAYYIGKESLISSAIENEIKNTYPHIKLVERKQFHTVLEELNLALSPLVPVQNKLQPRLLNAKLILFIETDTSLFQSFVLMRLIDTETGESLAFPVKKLESGRVASQNLSEHLLKTLKERYSSS